MQKVQPIHNSSFIIHPFFGPVVIKGKLTIHGMGGVGKTRAPIEYAWKHADDYRALLIISADTPEALQRNLVAGRYSVFRKQSRGIGGLNV